MGCVWVRNEKNILKQELLIRHSVSALDDCEFLFISNRRFTKEGNVFRREMSETFRKRLRQGFILNKIV